MGIDFFFAVTLKLYSTQEMGSSKNQRFLKWGTQEYTRNEQKTPALAESYNSLHYFVATVQCFRCVSKTNFQNSQLILFAPKLRYTRNLNKIQSSEDSSCSWMRFRWSFKVKYCLDSFTLNVCTRWLWVWRGRTSFYARGSCFSVSAEWQRKFVLFAMLCLLRCSV